jgi:hypothetical protein
MLKATFSNILVISFYWWRIEEYQEKNMTFSKYNVTNKPHKTLTSTPLNESNLHI